MGSMDRDRDSCEMFVRMCKGITAHARLKKEAYQVRNTKSIASQNRFFAEKGITLICTM